MEPTNYVSGEIAFTVEDASSLRFVRLVRHDSSRNELSLILDQGQFVHFLQDDSRTIVAVGVDEAALLEVIAELNNLHLGSGFSFVKTRSNPAGISEYRLHDADSVTPSPILLQQTSAPA
jgi:hypothetical protein